MDWDREWVERYHRKQTTTRTALARLQREYRIARGLLGELSPGALVLDAPCGIGPHTRRLREDGFRVLALDVNPWMLAYAQREAEPERCLQGDLQRLPLADQVVDAAIVIRIFHYLDQPAERRRVLAELARVVRGRVVISFMHPVAMAPLLKRRPTRKTQTLGEIRADAAACGLRVAKVRPVLPFVKRMWFAALEAAPATGG